MKNVEFMKTFQANEDLDENCPYFRLLKQLFLFFMFNYFLVKVAIVCKLHDDAELRRIYQRLFPSRNTYL